MKEGDHLKKLSLILLLIFIPVACFADTVTIKVQDKISGGKTPVVYNTDTYNYEWFDGEQAIVSSSFDLSGYYLVNAIVNKVNLGAINPLVLNYKDYAGVTALNVSFIYKEGNPPEDQSTSGSGSNNEQNDNNGQDNHDDNNSDTGSDVNQPGQPTTDNTDVNVNTGDSTNPKQEGNSDDDTDDHTDSGDGTDGNLSDDDCDGKGDGDGDTNGGNGEGTDACANEFDAQDKQQNDNDNTGSQKENGTENLTSDAGSNEESNTSDNVVYIEKKVEKEVVVEKEVIKEVPVEKVVYKTRTIIKRDKNEMSMYTIQFYDKDNIQIGEFSGILQLNDVMTLINIPDGTAFMLVKRE